MSKIINAEYILDQENNVELKVYLKFYPKSSKIEEFV